MMMMLLMMMIATKTEVIEHFDKVRFKQHMAQFPSYIMWPGDLDL